MVLSGTAVLGLTGCDGDKVSKEVSFAVNCNDPNNGNQTPEIDSIKQDSPYERHSRKTHSVRHHKGILKIFPLKQHCGFAAA